MDKIDVDAWWYQKLSVKTSFNLGMIDEAEFNCVVKWCNKNGDNSKQDEDNWS